MFCQTFYFVKEVNVFTKLISYYTSVNFSGLLFSSVAFSFLRTFNDTDLLHVRAEH